MSPARRLRLLGHFVRYMRPGQVVGRARLTVRRRVSAAMNRMGIGPGTWYRSPAPAPGEDFPGFPLLCERPVESGKRLPAGLDLVGMAWTVEEGMDWYPGELDRGSRLELLHLHYMDYLSGFSAESARALAVDWIRRNPPFRPGYWRADWNCYALSIRVVSWMEVLSRPDPSLEEGGSDEDLIRQSIAAQLRFLSRNLETDIGGNHLIKNIRALLRGARFFAGPEAAEWGRVGRHLLGRELEDQVLADGMHFERSPAYHLQVLGDLMDCWVVLEDGALRNRLLEVLERMAQVARDLTHPDGKPSLFNDGGLHMTTAPEVLFRAYQSLFRRELASRPTWFLPEAGFFGMRRGDELVVVDCGPLGPDHLPAHAHGDALAFEWSVGGSRLVVDAGVFEYHPGRLRDYCRSTVAHNTLTLDDRDQGEFWASFRLARRPRVTVEEVGDWEDGFVLQGVHDGYRRLEGEPLHRRRFHVRPGHIEIADTVVGGRGQRAVARLLLAPEATVELSERGARITMDQVGVELETTAGIEVVEGLWMPDFGEAIPTAQVVLDLGRAPCEGRFRLSLMSFPPTS